MSLPSFPHHHICHCISSFAWHCLTLCTPIKFIDAFPTLTHTDHQTTNWLRQDGGVSWYWWVYASISASFVADGCLGEDTSMAIIPSNGTSTSHSSPCDHPPLIDDDNNMLPLAKWARVHSSAHRASFMHVSLHFFFYIVAGMLNLSAFATFLKSATPPPLLAASPPPSSAVMSIVKAVLTPSSSNSPDDPSMMCLQHSRCVWKIQNTPDPVERRPSEYISVAMGGSESARGSSLAFSKQDRKCRHNP